MSPDLTSDRRQQGVAAVLDRVFQRRAVQRPGVPCDMDEHGGTRRVRQGGHTPGSDLRVNCGQIRAQRRQFVLLFDGPAARPRAGHDDGAGMARNLVAVVLGNAVGGGLLLGIVYYLI
jgi:hypothetical protein